MITPAKNSLHIFRSQIERCLQANEERFLLELQRVVDVAKGNSHIQRCIFEIEMHANNWAENFKKKELEIQGQIIQLKNMLIGRFPEIEKEEEKQANFPTFHHPTIKHFNLLLSGKRKPGIPLHPDPYEDSSLNRSLFRTLRDICARLFPKDKEMPKPIREPFYEIENKLIWLNNERLNLIRIHPAVIWAEIIKAVEAINPLPTPNNEPIDLNDLLVEAIHGVPFHKVLYGWRSQYTNVKPTEEEKAQYNSWKEYMTEGLQLFKNEIEVRLTTKISSEWAIKKYAARTGIYKFHEMRRALDDIEKQGKVKGKQSRIEAYLVDDAAAYLFDMGFGVLTERHLAGGRLDIYEETLGVEVARNALLIEAKIYKSASDGKAALKKGLSQIYGYASSIESSFHPTENFLFLFRLEGPKLVLPREPVQIGEYFFRIIHVDLAASEISGSRSPKPIIVDAEQIVKEISDKDTSDPNQDNKKTHKIIQKKRK